MKTVEEIRDHCAKMMAYCKQIADNANNSGRENAYLRWEAKADAYEDMFVELGGIKPKGEGVKTSIFRSLYFLISGFLGASLMWVVGDMINDCVNHCMWISAKIFIISATSILITALIFIGWQIIKVDLK